MHYESAPSIWKISELLTWQDMGFIPNTDNSDVENYCSFMGAYEICTMFEGIVPIVHGPIGCVSSYYSVRIASRLSEKIKPLPLSTSMDSNDVIFGAKEKLEKSIKEVDGTFNPKLIVILTTCVSDMINEDIDSVILKMEKSTKADIIHIKVGGISCKGFREGADQALKALMDYVNKKTPDKKTIKNSVNIFIRRVNGKLADDKSISEMKRILDINGIKVNAVVRVGMPFEELLQIPQAEANLSFCYTYGKEVMKHMQNIFEQKYSLTSYPIGLTGTLECVQSVSEILGVENKFVQSEEVKNITDELEKLKNFLSGRIKEKKAYIWYPGEKALAFVKVAYDLGLEPILIGFTYFQIKTARETLINMINSGNDPISIIRGHSMIWLDHENKYNYYERPLLFMPKKFWLGNLPCVDIDIFRDQTIGIEGLKNIISSIYYCYTIESTENNNLFDRYVERRYDKVEWNKKIKSIVRS